MAQTVILKYICDYCQVATTFPEVSGGAQPSQDGWATCGIRTEEYKKSGKSEFQELHALYCPTCILKYGLIFLCDWLTKKLKETPPSGI